MKTAEKLKITAGELGAEFGTKSGLTLLSLRDRKARRNILSSPRPLFMITARHPDTGEFITVDSASGWKNTECADSGNGKIFIVSGNEKLKDVTVILSASVQKEISRIEWNVEIINSGNEFAVYECDYPAVSFDAGKNIEFMSPYGPGELWNSLTECRSCQSYPSYGASMQYMTFWNKVTRRGFYYGLHDPAPAHKKLCFEKKADKPWFTLKAYQPLCDITRAGNSQSLYGSCVWQLYSGDWYDAAQIYRDFVTANAAWIPSAGKDGRLDEPEWMKTADHWWRVRMGDDESFADDILAANADLGYDSPVHLYDWHQIPYDNDYPHYFPVKPAFVTGVKRLREHGVKVMPYINGRLWDTRDKGTEDWQFSKVAKPNCTKGFGGKPFIETYSSKESDGSKVELSIMCPSTACWQEKVSELVKTLLNDYGVDAVYIDQIAAAQPYACEDRTHSHLAGGGSWWAESYNNLLDHVSKVMPEGTAITTECTADPFMKHIQGYLTWLWVHNRQVPAFVAVYSGMVTMFGRNYCFMPFDDDEGQRIAIAQSLTFGEELGWNDPKLYMQMKSREFYKNCVQKRRGIGSFFYNGRLLRSPEISDDLPAIRTTRNKESYGGVTEHSAVFCEHWERITDGKKLILFVNAAKEAAKAEIRSGIADGKYRLEGDKGSDLCIKDGNGVIELPPLSVCYAIY